MASSDSVDMVVILSTHCLLKLLHIRCLLAAVVSAAASLCLAYMLSSRVQALKTELVRPMEPVERH